MNEHERNQHEPDPGMHREQRPAHQARDVEPHDLANRDPQVPGDEGRDDADGDGQPETQPPPVPTADRARHAAADLQDDRDRQRTRAEPVRHEEPRVVGPASAQRQEARRRHEHDEHSEQAIE